MDPLVLPSPRLLRIREEILVFSISTCLAVISSLLALVVWAKVIHEAGPSRAKGNAVRAHSFRSIYPSAAFHWNWSISSVLETATWGTNSVFASFHLHVFTTSLMIFIPWVCSWLQGNGSVSCHLFPLRAGGGGEPSGPLFRMPCGSASSSRACSVACPTCFGGGCSDFYCICIFLLCIVLHICILLYVFFIIILWVLQGTSFYGDF